MAEFFKKTTNKNNLTQKASESHYISINKNLLKPDRENPRSDITEEMVAEKMRQLEAQGQLTAVVVDPPEIDSEGNEFYPIRDGELRWRAAIASEKIISLDAKVVYEKDDGHVRLAKQIMHNDLGSVSMHPLDIAKSFKKIADSIDSLTGETLGRAGAMKMLGWDPQSRKGEVSRMYKLLETPDFIIDFAKNNQIRDARMLADLSGIFAASEDLGKEALSSIEDSIKSKSGSARSVIADIKKRLPKKGEKSSKKIKAAKIKKARVLPAHKVTIKPDGDDFWMIEISRPKEILRFKVETENLEK